MKKPIVLITTSHANTSALEPITGDTQIIYSDTATAHALIKAGALPMYVPSLQTLSNKALDTYLNIASGVLLTGADTNTNPIYYGENPTHLPGRIDDERDIVDMRLITRAYSQNIPVLAICKGMQVANVAMGGSLYQNISAQCPSSFDHDIHKTNRAELTHKVHIVKGSILMKIMNKETMFINGGHTQGIKKLSKKFIAVAVAGDGIVEAFEARNKKFFMGIQFHAELRLTDRAFFKIFTTFVQSALAYDFVKTTKISYNKENL